ncbi:hypothetical protein EYR38_003151 [Pleurotus pulmonarius]|nr:hypothetical protein EYR38_003151 [Pleurotus pulmonarius]
MRPPNSNPPLVANAADNNTAVIPNEINGFKRLDIPSDGYSAGRSLFPGRVMAGYNAELDKYDADSWASYIVEECKAFGGDTTAVSYSAINSGHTGGRFWFGYAFSGGDTTVADFEKDDAVHGLRVYISS